MSAPLFIGTAGWSLHSRYARKFPAAGSHLERYAQRFDAAEINSSFYRPHRRTTYERWAASTPAHFRFAVKLPKAVTHERRLVDCGNLIESFVSEVAGLGTKLGCLLVQLPPSLAFEATTVSAFLDALQARTQTAVVCEPRHASWFTASVDAALAALQVARVAADPVPAEGAEQPGGWPGLVYYRLHGSPRMYYSDYGQEALAAIAQRIDRAHERGVPAWCMFDNTAASAAIGNALAVKTLTTASPR
ncbi:MAG: DUF72 domain-containing protein [Beijerinckiaceae bacterium]